MPTTDPDLAYWEFVDRHRVENFEPQTSYWEITPHSSTLVAKTEPWTDLFSFEQSSICFRRLQPPMDADMTLFSPGALREYQILSLAPGCWAMLPEQFKSFEPYLEPEYLRGVPVTLDEP